MKFENKIDRKIKNLSRQLASLSAHEFEKNNWWGDDTQLGDLPFEIQKKLARFTDWLMVEASRL